MFRARTRFVPSSALLAATSDDVATAARNHNLPTTPMLVAAMVGAGLAVVAAKLLNRSRLSRHFHYPPLVFVALTVNV